MISASVLVFATKYLKSREAQIDQAGLGGSEERLQAAKDKGNKGATILNSQDLELSGSVVFT